MRGHAVTFFGQILSFAALRCPALVSSLEGPVNFLATSVGVHAPGSPPQFIEVESEECGDFCGGEQATVRGLEPEQRAATLVGVIRFEIVNRVPE
jgi:hypothetical protein